MNWFNWFKKEDIKGGLGIPKEFLETDHSKIERPIAIDVNNQPIEFKNLEDIRGHYKKGCMDWWEYNRNGEDIHVEDLRQIGIKKIKFLSTYRCGGCGKCMTGGHKEDLKKLLEKNRELIGWIKLFLDITDEDLK